MMFQVYPGFGNSYLDAENCRLF